MCVCKGVCVCVISLTRESSVHNCSFLLMTTDEHAYAHTHTRTHAHTHAHTCMHAHTHTPEQNLL